MKKQEGYYDRLRELYERNKQILHHEEQVKAINPCFTSELEDYTRYMLFPDLKVFRAAELVDGD